MRSMRGTGGRRVSEECNIHLWLVWLRTNFRIPSGHEHTLANLTTGLPTDKVNVDAQFPTALEARNKDGHGNYLDNSRSRSAYLPGCLLGPRSPILDLRTCRPWRRQ